MKKKIRQQLRNRKRRIERRLDKSKLPKCDKPLLGGGNIHYEIADRVRGISFGGIGAMHTLARRIGLIDAIDRNLHVLKIHLPYHESDHVLDLAYNALCDGDRLQDIELRRNDEVFLDALGAARIPDPTTAGDFCRRLGVNPIELLQQAFDEVRAGVWAKQPPEFFERAIIDMDGIVVQTSGQCKEGMDIAYDGVWGYHPLVLTLANTGEVLRIRNRSGNRPSHEGAAAEIDRCLAVCFGGGFGKVLLRGDTDFSQTEHLDGWAADDRIEFIFGYDAMPNLKDIAEELPETAWQALTRPLPYEVQTEPRRRPAKVKQQRVIEHGYKNLRLRSEEVAEFRYQPVACRREYRLVVVRKNITKEQGGQRLFDEIRYLFYITNDWHSDADEIVFLANERCDQENVLAQLKNGVCALRAPVDTLVSNWAYMVMTALAWNLKAWWALSLPETGRWGEKYQTEKQWLLGLEFKTFLNAFVKLPCQIVRTGQRLVYRLLAWNPHQHIFFRLAEALRC